MRSPAKFLATTAEVLGRLGCRNATAVVPGSLTGSSRSSSYASSGSRAVLATVQAEGPTHQSHLKNTFPSQGSSHASIHPCPAARWLEWMLPQRRSAKRETFLFHPGMLLRGSSVARAWCSSGPAAALQVAGGLRAFSARALVLGGQRSAPCGECGDAGLHREHRQHRTESQRGTRHASSCSAAVCDDEQTAFRAPLFSEELSFDDEGFAIPHPIHPQQISDAEALREGHVGRRASETIQDSISGMLCILQLLPTATSEWIASFVGYHGISAMLQLHKDAASGNMQEHSTYAKPDTAAWELLARERGTRPQLQELLLDDGLPTLLRLTDGEEVQLPHSIRSIDVLAALDNLHERMRTTPERFGIDGVLLDAEDTLRACPEVAEYHEGSTGSYKHLFSGLRRSGISGTLHRVSCIEGVDGSITGLTVRVGRHMGAAAWPLTDVLAMIIREHRLNKYCHNAMSSSMADSRAGLPCSVLIIGGPASGKTTLLRDIAQQLSVKFNLGRRVVIVDSSNEIGGHGQVCSSGVPLLLSVVSVAITSTSCASACSMSWQCLAPCTFRRCACPETADCLHAAWCHSNCDVSGAVCTAMQGLPVVCATRMTWLHAACMERT
jgi:hypothetical protein